jgi:hypothetical protein
MQITLETFLKSDIHYCFWCGLQKKKMTTWKHTTGKVIYLCFLGCQNFPESFRKAIPQSKPIEWERIDQYQNYTRKQRYGQHNK